MLELRPNCECCDADLAPDVPGAMICSFECTFCAPCGDKLGGACPNCGGALSARPTRAAELLGRFPAATTRTLRAQPCVTQT
ncbi:MAG: DUF1272 domain-containing protein [Hyphomonadaceae bacterium]|nr:DUF1272 domain-containing protein [Hyphomonadaceae bacterium]